MNRRRRKTDRYSKKRTVEAAASQAGWATVAIIAGAFGAQLATPETLALLIDRFPYAAIALAIAVPTLGRALTNWAKNRDRSQGQG